jgi:triacylglycerol lipase
MLVVLLHGLARTSLSMWQMESALERAGYEVCNVSYPSRSHSVEVLAREFVAPAVARCFPDRGQPVNFVTHSLGGIIVRQLAADGQVGRLGRVVMLGPPNHGSEIVDRLGGWSLFRWINGPAGADLGSAAGSVPNRLGPAPFEAGVIAGSRSWNPALSSLLPEGNDGKVSIASARLDGMQDFLVLPVSHTFLAADRRAIGQTLAFLETGRFSRTGGRDQPGR